MSKIRQRDSRGSAPRKKAPYEGTYTRSGGVLTRTDGLKLLIRSRAEISTSKPGLFLLVQQPGSKDYAYLSGLYRNGTEFEDRASRERYRMAPADGDTWTIRCIGVPTRMAGMPT